MERKEKNGQEFHEDEYEKVCYVCRRPESKAGKMITMPGGVDVCRDCMQKAFDTVTKSGIDFGKFSGVTPELLWNGGMPFGMWQTAPAASKEDAQKNKREAEGEKKTRQEAGEAEKVPKEAGEEKEVWQETGAESIIRQEAETENEPDGEGDEEEEQDSLNWKISRLLIS